MNQPEPGTSGTSSKTSECSIVEPTFGKQGKVLHGQARQVVANVLRFMKDEAEHFRTYNKHLIPITHFKERVYAAISNIDSDNHPSSLTTTQPQYDNTYDNHHYNIMEVAACCICLKSTPNLHKITEITKDETVLPIRKLIICTPEIVSLIRFVMKYSST